MFEKLLHYSEINKARSTKQTVTYSSLESCRWVFLPVHPVASHSPASLARRRRETPGTKRFRWNKLYKLKREQPACSSSRVKVPLLLIRCCTELQDEGEIRRSIIPRTWLQQLWSEGKRAKSWAGWPVREQRSQRSRWVAAWTWTVQISKTFQFDLGILK